MWTVKLNLLRNTQKGFTIWEKWDNYWRILICSHSCFKTIYELGNLVFFVENIAIKKKIEIFLVKLEFRALAIRISIDFANQIFFFSQRQLQDKNKYSSRIVQNLICLITLRVRKLLLWFLPFLLPQWKEANWIISKERGCSSHFHFSQFNSKLNKLRKYWQRLYNSILHDM